MKNRIPLGLTTTILVLKIKTKEQNLGKQRIELDWQCPRQSLIAV